MSEQEQTADASREAYYDWWVENSPTDHSHHVVHGTKGSIEALKAVEAERDTLREKLSSTTEDYIRERNAATEAEIEVRRLREWNARLLSQATVAEEEARQAQDEADALREKLEEKGRVFSENLLMQGEEITRLRADNLSLAGSDARILDG